MKTVNLLIHVANCCLLFHFFKAILINKKTRFLAILMFSVHPIHIEAVCDIFSRSDLMACFILMLSGIFYFNVFRKGKLLMFQLNIIINENLSSLDSNSFKLKHFTFLMIIGVFTLIGVLFKENSIMIMVRI